MEIYKIKEKISEMIEVMTKVDTPLSSLSKLIKPSKSLYDIVICTPKVRHIWRCIFLWAKQEEKTKRTRQNSKSML